MAKWRQRSMSMTPIFNIDWKNPKIHIWCKFGDFSSNPLQVVSRTNLISLLVWQWFGDNYCEGIRRFKTLIHGNVATVFNVQYSVTFQWLLWRNSLCKISSRWAPQDPRSTLVHVMAQCRKAVLTNVDKVMTLHRVTRPSRVNIVQT